jgi:hypothetical protein
MISMIKLKFFQINLMLELLELLQNFYSLGVTFFFEMFDLKFLEFNFFFFLLEFGFFFPNKNCHFWGQIGEKHCLGLFEK